MKKPKPRRKKKPKKQTIILVDENDVGHEVEIAGIKRTIYQFNP